MSGVVKRPHDEVGGSSSSHSPETLKKKMVFEPFQLGRVSSLEELNFEVLKIQHEKLAERFVQRQQQVEDLNKRIKELEKELQGATDLSNGINRYWSQLNEDLLILLHKFVDVGTTGVRNGRVVKLEERDTHLLPTCHTNSKDLDLTLAEKVLESTHAVLKIQEAFENLRKQNEEITAFLFSNDSGARALDPAVRDANNKLESENRRVHALNLALLQKHQDMSLNVKELEQKLAIGDKLQVDLKNEVEDLSGKILKLVSQNDKLLNKIQNRVENFKPCQRQGLASDVSKSGSQSSSLGKKEQTLSQDLVALQKENMVLQDLANSRLSELEDIYRERQEQRKELERLRQDIRYLPERVILESVEYKCLQSKFSVVYNDNQQLRSVLTDMKHRMMSLKDDHMKHIEQLAKEEEARQNQHKMELVQMEVTLAQYRKQNEMMKIEFEQTIKTNDQSAPITREMRVLITSLQNHNEQLKVDNQKQKKKYKDVCTEISKLKRQKIEMAAVFGQQAVGKASTAATSSTTFTSKTESDAVKELRSELKKSLNTQKEMKTLLDLYKGASKEHRDKVELMSAERKLRQELEEVKEAILTLQSTKPEENKKEVHVSGESEKRIKCLEEQVYSLQRQVTNQKQEENALVHEMETTGQAFEDMQEQNARLLQELREKDDANFKLMSDKIKLNSVKELVMEESRLLTQQKQTLSKQIEAQCEVMRQMEEKEKILLQTLSSREKEGVLKQQAMDAFKSQMVEEIQKSTDLKLLFDKSQSQFKDSQQTVVEKTLSLETETQKARRLQEEVIAMKVKVERLNKIAKAKDADEVHKEEIRIYKEALTCPSCKVNKKDAVLTKCFHVFCYSCLKTQYETRQRKCPKCNAAFGHNDFHLLYLT